KSTTGPSRTTRSSALKPMENQLLPSPVKASSRSPKARVRSGARFPHFTWLHSPVFRATPLDMKAEADIDFIMGENQIIGHGWPYSPPPGKVPEPGWSLYAAASFNNHNPWHPVMPDVTRYIQRISYLLRQGE